jgi:hypothetical protein
MRLVKEIKSKTGELHFRRWKFFEIKNLFSIYIHKIYLPDYDEHLHNHPWNYVSIILDGGYIELDHNGNSVSRRTGSISVKSSESFHKITHLYKSPTKTIVITGPKKQHNWGYLVNGQFAGFKTYRKLKNDEQ